MTCLHDSLSGPSTQTYNKGQSEIEHGHEAKLVMRLLTTAGQKIDIKTVHSALSFIVVN